MNKDEIAKIIKENEDLKEKVKNQAIEISILKQYIFARKNEKWAKIEKEHKAVFNEVEAIADKEETVQKEPSVKRAAPKKKPGRKPLPKSIPRSKVIIDIDENDKKCPCCNKLRPLIAEEISEELEFIPAQILVKAIHLKKYGACSCKEFQTREDLSQVIQANTPARFIPGGIASPSLIAHIIVNKYCDAIPLYRQQAIFNRIGVDISRQNMSNWVISASKKCADIIEYMRKTALQSNLINMDETRIQVLKEKDRDPEKNSFMWVMVGGQEEKKVVLFNYSPTRNQEIPVNLLDGFNGVLQTDGYAAYNKAVNKYGLWHVGCSTHARRKFYEIAKATKRKGKAHNGVEFFSKLYEIEHKLKEENLPPENYIKRRRELAIPVWKEFNKWLKELKQKIVPDSPLAKAINYSLNQYSNLVRYLKYAEIRLDNNIAENAIRPFCVGRKNWLFCNTPNGAYASAAIYSLVETAKLNHVEPDRYLNYIFSEIPKITAETDYEGLMPWNLGL